MNGSRRRLLFASAGAGAVAVVVSACGGGGGYSPPPPSSMPPPPPSPPGTLSCGATLISSNHGHMLTIPAADTMSTVSITYNIQGIADHNHMITLTPAQLAQIGTKSGLTVTSTFGASASFPNHDHAVTVNCA